MAGLLVLTLPYRQLTHHLPQVIGGACKKVADVLYVHFDPATATPPTSLHSPPRLSVAQASNLIQRVYSNSLRLAPSVDVRVILTGFKGISNIPSTTRYPVVNVMLDSCKDDDEIHYYTKRYRSYLNDNRPVVVLDTSDIDIKLEHNSVSWENETNEEGKIYKSIVAGGTFDNIHTGHKILVSEGLLRCTSKFTIGIADGPLLVKKTLSELIQPVDARIRKLHELLVDIDNTVEYRLEPIYEPMGPSGEDPEMEMIIVSQETLKGGHYVNKVRKERGLSTLDVVSINLIDDPLRNASEEQKVSSSSLRMRALGTLLKPRLKSRSKGSPYIIGLTGGSASGKTSLSSKMSAVGAKVIDCDKLGHQAYVKGTACYEKLVSEFGEGVVNEDGSINRKALGSIVFQDEAKLKLLNSIVWPEIKQLVEKEIKESGGKVDVVVLDAAVLLEAKWNDMCNEVWVCVVPATEAVKRISSRDGCSEEQAQQRLSKQLSNRQRVEAAHVVFCTLWDYQYTQQQLMKAWRRLEQEGVITTRSPNNDKVKL